MSTGSDPVVGIGLEVQLAAFRAQLKEASAAGGAEFKALAQEIDRSLRKATASQKSFADQTKATKLANEALTRTLQGVGGKANSLARDLGVVSDGAADFARGMGDVAGLGEAAAEAAAGLGVSATAAGAALAVVATVAAAAALAYANLTEESRQAAELAGDQAAAYERLEPVLRSTRLATIDLQEATGALSEMEAALARNHERAHEAMRQAIDPTVKKIQELRKEQASWTTQVVDMIPTWTPLGVVIDGVTRSSEELEEQIAGEMRIVETAAGVIKKNVKATDEATAAKIRLKNAVKDLMDWENAELGAETQADILRARMAERRAATQQLENEQLNEAAQETADAVAKIETERTAQHAKEVKKRKAAEEKYQKEVARIEALQLSSSADLYGGISDLAGVAADQMAAKNVAAARAMFAVQKATGLAAATINAAQGVSEAAASAPPPYNAIPIAAAIAQGAANVAAVAAVQPPSFEDTPGPMQMQRGGTVRFADGDYFAAAKNPSDLQRQTGAAAFSRVDHRAFDYWIRDHLKMPNSALAKAIRGAR